MTAPRFETWESWAAYWRPLRAPDARAEQDDWDGALLEILNPTHRALIDARAGERAEHLWTLLDGDGLSLVVCAGKHVVDRMAYILTERAHTGCPATPQLVLGDPEVSFVPEEVTDDELAEALDDYEFDAAQPGEQGRIGKRNLNLLRAERERRT